jgi:rhodanese-related sulfurtransferase
LGQFPDFISVREPDEFALCHIEGAIIDKNARIGADVVIRPFPRNIEIKKENGYYILTLPLPFTAKEKVSLNMRGQPYFAPTITMIPKW